jgi:hypothetical protein
MNYLCPVCFFDEMPYPPNSYNICPCCGTEFDNDDVEFSYDELRLAWMANGAAWFYGDPPVGWNPWAQLASHAYGVSTGVEPLSNKTRISDQPLKYAIA